LRKTLPTLPREDKTLKKLTYSIIFPPSQTDTKLRLKVQSKWKASLKNSRDYNNGLRLKNESSRVTFEASYILFHKN
jgi:hypothetical protein